MTNDSGFEDNNERRDDVSDATSTSVSKDVLDDSMCRLRCPACSTLSEVEKTASEWVCPSCDQACEIGVCRFCTREAQVRSEHRSKWACPWCHRKNGWLSSRGSAEGLVGTMMEWGLGVPDDDPDRRALVGVVALNGPHGKYPPKTRCVLLFTRAGLTLTTWADADIITAPYTSIRALDISGPGVVRRGGSFVGGGFGAVGAVEGMMLASVLNAVTTKSSIQTVIRLETQEAEYFFTYDQATPEQLRIRLSPVFTRIKQASDDRLATPLIQGQSSHDMLEQLERLGTLFTSGVLEADEFRVAKGRILQMFNAPPEQEGLE